MAGLVLLSGLAVGAVAQSIAAAPQASATAPSPEMPASQDWEKAAGGRMSFDVASVKLNTSGQFQRSNIDLDANDSNIPAGGSLRATSFQIITLVQFAYKLQLTPVQVSAILAKQPAWFNQDRFDIEAHGPQNATKDQMRLMMQSLLADRFKLSFHFETREQSVFALVVDKSGKIGPQLIPHSQGAPCDDATTPQNASPPSTPPNPAIFPASCNVFAVRFEQGRDIQMGARNTTMDRLAATLGTLPGETTIDRTVINKTGLTGTFDVTLKYTPDGPVSLNGGHLEFDDSQPTLFSALKEELGLKLENQTAPVATLVVDHIEEPTPN